MSVYIDIKSRFDDASGRKAAEEAKKYFANAGTDAGNDFSGNFGKAVEQDGRIRAAADKVADSLDKITAAEAKRATQMEKSKAISVEVGKAEENLARLRSIGADASAAVAEEKLTALRAKQVDIDNKLVVSSAAVSRANRDKARAIREAGDAYKQMGDDAGAAEAKLKSFDSSALASFGKLNAGLTGIGLLPAAATAITEVAGALNQLAGAGFAVPGIFAGIASSVGVGALGIHGMADAIKAVDKASDGSKAHVKAADEAMKDLSPSAADAVKTIVGLKGTLTGLEGISSTNLLAGFSDDLKGLVSADLPAATRGVDSISKALNQNLREAMRSLGTSSSQGFLDRIFGNTADAQSKLTTAINPIVHAVGELSAVGSDSLPRLATDIGNIADRFDRFISAADSSGKLDKWINDGITGFEQLGNTALNLGKSFESIVQAAGGGTGLLGTLESASQRLATFLDSANGQQTLSRFFAEGRDTLGQLKDIATQAGPILAGVFQSGISAAQIWLPVIKDVLQTINGIPGGAQAVVAAFAAWEGIKGIASVATGLSSIANILKFVIPGAATEGAAGITAAFAGITLPAWLSSFLAAGGSIAALPATAAGFAAWGNDQFKQHPEVTQSSPETARARGVKGLTGSKDPAYDSGNNNGYAGGGGSFDVGGKPIAPGYAGFLDPTWTPVAGQSTSEQPHMYRTRDGQLRAVPNSGAAALPGTPGVSGYTPYTLDPSAAGGAKKPPYIDPSKYMLGDPLAGLPAAASFADPQKVFEADSSVITNTHDLEQKKLALAVLEAKGNATQQELLTAKNDIQEKERSLYDAQAKDLEARSGQIKKAASDLKDVFAPLDKDFGVSKGLPGIVENLTKLLGDFALGGAIKSSPELQSAALSLMSEPKPGSAASANAANRSAIGQQFFGGGAGYAGDAALLSNVPAGKYTQEARGDLTKGLADCSSAVEDLVNLMQGNSTAGASMSTGNEASWLTQHGLLPTNQPVPGALNVGFNSQHTQATLPGGTNFNWGSDAAAARGGVGGTGAFDPAFDQHYYLPAAPSAMGPAPIGGGVGPTSPTGWGASPLGLTGGGAGPGSQGIVGQTPGALGQGAGQGFNTGVQPAANPGGGGVGITPGGTLDSALTAAASIFPGGGMAAQVAIKEANRAIQFAGQAAGIGVSGVMETLLPAGSPLAANSWFSKLAGGIAGARPASPNKAGGPNGGQPGQPAPPMGTPASGQGAGPQPGPTVGTLNYTNNQATEDRAGADLTAHLTAMSSGVGH